MAARLRAVQAVNTTLIDLYWQVGQTISQKIAQAQWGDGVVAQLAAHLAQTQPGLRGFSPPATLVFTCLGAQHITPARIQHLRQQIEPAERVKVLEDIALAPAWMRPHLRAAAAAGGV
jgi:hypothetical protein